MTELVEEIGEEPGTEITESEVEVVARKHGWVPQDEFTGDETNWVDAEKWESRSKRERLLETEVGNLERAIEQNAEMLKRLEAREHTLRDEAEKSALVKLKAQMKDAVAEGDADKADAAAVEYAKQTAEQKVEPYTSAADIAARDTFLDANPIYQRQDIAASAATVSARIIAKASGLPIQQVLDQTHEEIKKIYKEHFVNEARGKPSAVESGGSRLTQKKETMPKEFRDAMEEYANTQVVYSKKYRPKDGESVADAKKRARQGYKDSFEIMGLTQ